MDMFVVKFISPKLIYGEQTYTESHETIHIISNTRKVILFFGFCVLYCVK